MKSTSYKWILLCVILFQIYRIEAKPAQPQYLYVSESYKLGMFAQFSFIAGLLYEYDATPGNYSGFEVDFKKTGLYYDPLYGPNWWNYFCEPICLGNRSGAVVREYKARDYRVDFTHAIVTILQLTKEQVFGIIQKYIKVKQPILDKVEANIQANFTNSHMIGVHYRGTDKKKEVPRVPYEDFSLKVREYVDAEGLSDYKIFVATDEQLFVEYMNQEFPNRIVTYDTNRSSDGQPLHEKKLLNQYECGESAIIDCLLLSHADVLIRNESNLSLWSTFFNPKIKEIVIQKANPKKNSIASELPFNRKHKKKK